MYNLVAPSQPVIIFILKCEEPTTAYKMTMSRKYIFTMENKWPQISEK